jgi:TetR/AcrR family transcriptional regulator
MGRFDSAQRTRILEAAIPVFAQQGLEGAAIRLVGKVAGVNSALLYYYFENKYTLFVEAVHFVLRGLLEHLAQQQRAFADGRERLTFLATGILDYYDAHPARMRLMGMALIRHADLLGQGVQRLIDERIPLPLEVLQEGMRRGELRPAHPLQAWWSILGVCLFSLEMREVVKHVDSSTLPLPLPDAGERRSQILDMLCAGLAMPHRPTKKKKRTQK